MAKKSLMAMALMFLMILMTVSAWGEVPNRINYQGRLTDSGGNPLTGTYEMTFYLLDAPTLGTIVWSENHPSVTVTNGIYNVQLGSVGNPFSPILFHDYSELYLEVQINSETLEPRQRLTCTAFAMKAALADGVVDGAVTTVMIADSAVDNQKVADSAITSTKIADGTVTAVDIADGSGSGLDADKLDGHEASDFITTVNAGIGLVASGSSGVVNLDVEVPLSLGTSSAGAIFYGANAGNGPGVRGDSAEHIGVFGSTEAAEHSGVFGVSTNGVGVRGISTNNNGVVGSTSAQDRAGVYGHSEKGLGVYGIASGSEGRGVYGEATALGGSGVYGYSSAPSGGVSFGVYGKSDSGIGVYASGLWTGLFAEATADSGNSPGVYGESSSNEGYGVYGYASAESGTNYGIYGWSSSNEGYGGYFLGRGYFSGNVGIGTDSPATKFHVVGGSDADVINPSSGFLVIGPTNSANIVMDSNEIIARNNNSTSDLYMQKDSRNVSIGTADAPTQKLDVNGNARFRAVGSATANRPLSLTSDGTLTTAGVSDRRLKTNIENIEDGLKIVEKLQGVRFNWKENAEGKRRIGLIAQDVEKVVPELTFTNPVDGYMGINYAELSAVLIEAVKEQQQTIEKLTLRVDELETSKRAEIEFLKDQLTSLQKAVQTLIAQQSDLKDNNERLSMKTWR